MKWAYLKYLDPCLPKVHAQVEAHQPIPIIAKAELNDKCGPKSTSLDGQGYSSSLPLSIVLNFEQMV